MNINGKRYRTIWLDPANEETIQIIDQVLLPFRFKIQDLRSVQDVAIAIKDMQVRGAGLIGATAGYGMYLAALEAAKSRDFMKHLHESAKTLTATRPTAVNLKWAVERQLSAIGSQETTNGRINTAKATACAIADEDATWCQSIGKHGVRLISQIAAQKNGEPVNILTHCNAGWLAFVDHGSATAPMYEAFERGIPIHIWVDETRPRNQGARLTAWELAQHGVPHTVIADNAGGHLMQHGMVDLVITGADRVTYTGDVANKIGTYLKALAAKDNHIPFYVALPSSTFDWKIRDGVHEIPVEQRGENEIQFMEGLCGENVETVRILPPESPAANYGFDVTPARLVTGLITERGICPATEEGIRSLFPM